MFSIAVYVNQNFLDPRLRNYRTLGLKLCTLESTYHNNNAGYFSPIFSIAVYGNLWVWTSIDFSVIICASLKCISLKG